MQQFSRRSRYLVNEMGKMAVRSYCLPLFDFIQKSHPLYSTKRLSASTLSEDEKENRRKEIMARGLPKRKPLPGVKHIVLVASGKGGVGKSTAAVNIALGLKLLKSSSEIGLLDADVFGPTVPLMMNLHEDPLVSSDNLMKPLINYGVKCMSMGFLTREKAVIWRGLMVMTAVEKMLRGTAWGPLDILVVDTPPGTSDAHLSLAQLVPISGAILVTTPQTAAVQVTHKGAEMFHKLKIPIIGVIHNMAWTFCPSCNAKINCFGSDGMVKKLAIDIGTDILEEIPMDRSFTKFNESGKPVVISDPSGPMAEAFKNVATKIYKFVNSDPGDAMKD